MFPLQQGDELCFNTSSHPQQQHDHQIRRDLIMSHSGRLSDHIITPQNRRRKSSHVDVFVNDDDSSSSKKVMHRNIERQRRQEMATLFKSLRSLLPLEFIKGKRSISDQMNEAVKYINHLQRNIKELVGKRDDLKNLSNFSNFDDSTMENTRQDSSVVVITTSFAGAQICLSCGNDVHSLSLSKVLEVVLEEGLSVLNCISTRVGDRVLHSIQTEIDDPMHFDVSCLQQKLNQLE